MKVKNLDTNLQMLFFEAKGKFMEADDALKKHFGGGGAGKCNK